MKKLNIIAITSVITLTLVFLLMATPNVKAEENLKPVTLEVGVWLVNVEKVDLSASSYRLDFYLWFKFNPQEVSLSEVREFEFVNGLPTKYEVRVDEENGYLEYRVKGDFIKTFDFSKYPYETHTLTVELEHKSLNASKLILKADPTSSVDEGVNIAGWEIGEFKTYVVEHSYGDNVYSRFIFSIQIKRPTLSSFVKSVLPVTVITTISLLTFLISPQNFGQRIGLGVTTLMSATTFHLALLGGIPPVGYLTLADKMMISIYVIFLYNLSVSVYIMKLVDMKKIDEAQKFNGKAAKFLPALIAALVMIQLLLF
ncbi:MAG: hypothetical protein QW770_00985 [Candidatus Bathyarchaeia archaeon]